MKKTILSIIILFSFVINFNVNSHIDHYSNLNYLEYELFRNNKSIGYHKFDFERKGDNLLVTSEVNFKITKLGVELYKYFAKSEENYEKGVFKSYSSKTKQNKKDRYVNINADQKEQSLIIDGSSYKGKANKEFIVGTWWNHEIIKSKAQISAISGRIIKQKVTFIGKEQLTINGKKYNALHFNFSSSDKNLPKEKRLNTDIWYDENNFLWLKAAFDKQGYWEYRLISYK